MSLAFNLLLACIIFASGSAVHDGSAAQSLIAALAGVALACVTVAARAADVKFASLVAGGLKYAAAVPAILMVLQLLPVPFGAHSIWAYANDALGRRFWGHITVDLGATVLALAFYLATISLVLVSVFVAKDRRRAELLLLVLTAATSITPLILLAGKWGLIAAPGDTNDVLAAVSALGILLSLTSAVRAIERHNSGSAEAAGSTKLQVLLVASGVAVLICLGGLATSATPNVALIAAFGVIVFASLQVIRRIRLAGWATGILVATMIVAAVMIILWRYDAARTLSPLLQFAAAASPDTISIAQRLLSDAGPLGTGAGSYVALLPIYQDLDGSVARAPSTAAALAIELGWPMALLSIGIAVWLVVIFYRAALARGRDSFYPAAAAACTIVMFGQAFCDASLSDSCVAVVGATTIGLGLAQSVSSRDGR